MEQVDTNLKQKLRELRNKKSQKETAEGIGIPYANYNKYETSNVLPDIITLSKIANYYNVSIDYLIGRKFPNDLGLVSSEQFYLFKKILLLNSTNLVKLTGYVDSLVESQK